MSDANFLPTPQVEYRIHQRDLPLFDFLYEPGLRKKVEERRKTFRRVLAHVPDAFVITPDGRVREDTYWTMGIPFAKAMSPAQAQLLFKVWQELPMQNCVPCRRRVLGDAKCIECRVKPRATPRNLAALVRKLEAQYEDVATGDFHYWLADRIKRADGRKCQSKVLYEDYREWVRSKPLTRPEKRATRNTKLSHRKFGEFMRIAGYRRRRHGRGIFYLGVALRRAQHYAQSAVTTDS